MTLLTPIFVPADRPERFAKAASSGADAIIIDLEDAVAPAAKASARAAISTPGVLPAGCQIIVRINGFRTPWHDADILALSGLPIAAVMLPKTESAGEVGAISCVLHGMGIVALIETAKGLAAARDIAAERQTAQLAFGSIDFAADIGAAHTREALLAARSEIILASRLSALPKPIDGVTIAVDDPGQVEDDARYAAMLGFGGKMCIHPKQILPARRGFMPSAADVEWARQILNSEAEGAIMVDGAMVDAPVRARARQILLAAQPI